MHGFLFWACSCCSAAITNPSTACSSPSACANAYATLRNDESRFSNGRWHDGVYRSVQGGDLKSLSLFRSSLSLSLSLSGKTFPQVVCNFALCTPTSFFCYLSDFFFRRRKASNARLTQQPPLRPRSPLPLPLPLKSQRAQPVNGANQQEL